MDKKYSLAHPNTIGTSLRQKKWVKTKKNVPECLFGPESATMGTCAMGYQSNLK